MGRQFRHTGGGIDVADKIDRNRSRKGLADDGHKDRTKLIISGRDPFDNYGIVNPPVYHASTILFPTVEKLEQSLGQPFVGTHYGAQGSPTSFAFQDAIAEIEGGDRAIVYSTGLAAITTALQAFLKSGDHALIVDSVYGPTRSYCDRILKGFGVEIDYYDPLVGGQIKTLFKENTKLVFTESPGSLTFEIQDIPAISKAAHEIGAVVIMDNTWATPLYFKAIEHGVDVSIHAATKYIVGHADAMLGVSVTTEEAWLPVRRATSLNGHCAGPDDIYLGLRGLRTLGVRLKQHQETALTLIDWLRRQPEVERILYPALEDDPGYSIWKRDFLGASGLFGVVLSKPFSTEAIAAMHDGMKLLCMGESWGGYESLMLPRNPARIRSATKWETAGPLLRIHAGLEDPDDLIADLEAGFGRLREAG